MVYIIVYFNVKWIFSFKIMRIKFYNNFWIKFFELIKFNKSIVFRELLGIYLFINKSFDILMV